MSDFFTDFPDEDSQTKEIYARFGLAAYLASVFEEGVAIEATLLALVQEVRKGNIKSKAEWQRRHDEEMKLANALPLGRGLTRLQNVLKLPDELQELFDEALRTRNYLIHHFFRDEIHEFNTAAGRLRMYERLMTSVDLFSGADRELMNATSELRHKIGLTDEKLRRDLEDLEAEYRRAQD